MILKRKAIFNFLILIVSLFLSLFAIELGIRLIYPQNISFITFDEELGWIHKKSTHGYWRQENNRPSIVNTNSMGLRSAEIMKGSHVGKLRILILGDSFTQGLSVDDTLTFSSLLEKELTKALHTEVEVINGGVGGYGPIQHYLLFERLKEVYFPDIVIQAFFTENDMVDNTDPAGGRRPIGSLVNQKLHISKPAPTSGAATWLRDNILSKSHAAYFLRANVIPRFRFLAKGMEKMGMAHYDGINREELHVEEQWNIVEASIRRIKFFCESHNMTYGYFIIPYITKNDQGELGMSQNSSTTQTLLNDYSKGSGIASYDLERDFMDVAQEIGVKEIYHDGFGHFTEEGNRLTAKSLLPFLLELIQSGDSLTEDNQ